jgi:hypothetical protein
MTGSPTSPDGVDASPTTVPTDSPAEVTSPLATTNEAAAGDLCAAVARALHHAQALAIGLPSTCAERLAFLGRIKHWSIAALEGLVDLSDEARYGQMPVSLRLARTWAGLARRELEQQLENAQLPGAIVLTGHLTLAIARALDSIQRAMDSLAEGQYLAEGDQW